MVTVFGVNLTNEFLFQSLTLLVSILVLVAIIVFSFLFLKKQHKTPEQKHASVIAKKILLLHEGKVPKKKKTVDLHISKAETSLKSLLIKKFKPKIESQLGSKIVVLDINAKDEVFLVLAEVAGAKVLLKLDASGTILDYERPKKKQ